MFANWLKFFINVNFITNKISCFINRKHTNKRIQVPVRNLSDYVIDTSSLKYGLNHSFIYILSKSFLERETP